MNQVDHLKTYKMKLITKSPLFIGSGQEYGKKDYYYDRSMKKVYIIDIPKLITYLYSNELIEEYERYILQRPYEDLYRFFQNCKVSKKDIQSIINYELDVSDALVEDKSLSAIKQFIRDARFNPYVPGSSIKGAIRTAILWKLISESPWNVNDNMKTKEIEARYLNTIGLNKSRGYDETNSIMRGISISDSVPIRNDRMILTKKKDVSTVGNKNTINVIREAICPSTVIQCTLTLDISVSSQLNIDFIQSAVREYGIYYKETFARSFSLPRDSEVESFDNCLVIGGGSGYFGKNIVYKQYGKPKAVYKVSKIMEHKFPRHNHNKDISLGISPHMLKYTEYHSKLYHYGVCRVEIHS